jgi:cyclophilin family peptidyl-prolyl cis-trans isomerase
MKRPYLLGATALTITVLVLTLVWWTGREPVQAAEPNVPAAEAPAADEVVGEAIADDPDVADESGAQNAEPAATESENAAEPAGAAEADATESDTTEPVTAESDATAPGAADPEAAEPDATEPQATEPEATAPDADPALGEVPVPEGYEIVPPLSEERRIAFEAPEDVLDPSLDYAAVIEATAGTMVVDLFETATPETVNNFVFLARHHYYDGIVFHRVLDGFMAQTGDPTGTGTGGPGYQFADEIVDELSHDAPGVLSMANAGPGTNGSQFFLTFAATPWLDGAHTVFGRVTEGLDVLDEITRVDPQQPSVVALLSDPVEEVRAQGIDLEGEGTLEEALTATLGAPPVPGPSVEVAGARVAIGSVEGQPAAGFFPFPDRMERVTIVARPRD